MSSLWARADVEDASKKATPKAAVSSRDVFLTGRL